MGVDEINAYDIITQGYKMSIYFRLLSLLIKNRGKKYDYTRYGVQDALRELKIKEK